MAPEGLQIIRDDTGELAAWFARQRQPAVVVRPDRYVFAAFDARTPVTGPLRDLLRPTPQSVSPRRYSIKRSGFVQAALTLVGMAMTASRTASRKRTH